MPSVVSYTASDIVLGVEAVALRARNAKNTISNAPAMVGKTKTYNVDRSFGGDDEDEGEASGVEVSAEEVFTMFVANAKAAVEAALDGTVEEGVFVVPPGFDKAQRDAVIAAAEAAGVQVVQMVDPSVAAVISYMGEDTRAGPDPFEIYGDEEEDEEEEGEPEMYTGPKDGKKYVAVVDVGSAASFTVACVSGDGIVNVLEQKVDAELGASVLDEALVAHFAKEFQRKMGMDVTTSPRAVRKLEAAVERVKVALSSSSSAVLVVESLMDGMDFSSKLGRARLESIGSKYFRKIGAGLSEVLEAAGVNPDDLASVYVTGGSGAIPKLTKALKSKVGEGTVIYGGGKSSTAASLGAALMGHAYGDAGVCNAIIGDESARYGMVVETKVSSVGLWLEGSEGGAPFELLKVGSLLPAVRYYSIPVSGGSGTRLAIRLLAGAVPGDAGLLADVGVLEVGEGDEEVLIEVRMGDGGAVEVVGRVQSGASVEWKGE